MIAAAMIKEFFAVIGSESHHRVFPQAQTSQRVHQTRYLRIHPANACVVESNDIFTAAFQALLSKIASPQVTTVPVRIQISRPRGIERRCAPSDRALLVADSRANADPSDAATEKMADPQALRPVAGMVNHHIGGRKTPQLVE